jgi:hypothetical protein
MILYWHSHGESEEGHEKLQVKKGGGIANIRVVYIENTTLKQQHTTKIQYMWREKRNYTGFILEVNKHQLQQRKKHSTSQNQL